MKSCLNTILNPFSAVFRFQKEFANDVIENVKKQRDSFSKHHREMALRRQELHLDELEEKYKCCVCGTRGLSRDFEPPVVLVNALADTVTAAADVVAHEAEKKKKKRNVRVTILDKEDGGTPQAHHSSTVSPRPDEAAMVEEELTHHDDSDPPDPPLASLESTEETCPQEMPPITAKEVQMMIKRARREVINAQKLKRLEEKHRKEGSYHKDKGLTRIHETDVAAFSAFFQKPVRGFLCTECHNSARKRLDVLTEEIQFVITKSRVPFTRHHKGSLPHRPEGAIKATEDFASRTHVPGRPEGDGDVLQMLHDEDILALRQLQACGVCRNRAATYVCRKNVLFLCAYCCAIDRFYRRTAVCINDEPMSAECCTLLQVIAKTLRGENDHQTVQNRALVEANVRKFEVKHHLFGRKHDLFVAQDPGLCSPLRKRSETAPHALCAMPDFSQLMDDREQAAEARFAKARALARSTTVSLFQGLQFAPHIDLFQSVSQGSDAEAVVDPSAPRCDDNNIHLFTTDFIDWNSVGPSSLSSQQSGGGAGPKFDALLDAIGEPPLPEDPFRSFDKETAEEVELQRAADGNDGLDASVCVTRVENDTPPRRRDAVGQPETEKSRTAHIHLLLDATDAVDEQPLVSPTTSTSGDLREKDGTPPTQCTASSPPSVDEHEGHLPVEEESMLPSPMQRWDSSLPT